MPAPVLAPVLAEASAGATAPAMAVPPGACFGSGTQALLQKQHCRPYEQLPNFSMSGHASSGSLSTSSHLSTFSSIFFHFSVGSSHFEFFHLCSSFACSASFSFSSFSSLTFCRFAPISIVCTSSGALISPLLRPVVYVSSFCSVVSRSFSTMSSRIQFAVKTPGLNFSITMMFFRTPLTSDQKIFLASDPSGLIRSLRTRPVFQMKLSSSLRVGDLPLFRPASIWSTFAFSSLQTSSKYWSFLAWPTMAPPGVA
mmetsp:Transcript_77220/g.218559  ORF Transcript_77220/g.218559 Transcript_77220/m.218559 type:complete len:255 (+) Transcript_77220:112-876(+)